MRLNWMDKLDSCYESVRARISFAPKIGIVLGSGLGEFGERIELTDTLPYGEIEGFPVSTVNGHKGRFLFGTLEGVPVVVMQGRVHHYEGYPMTDVVLPTRLMGRMGVKILLLTNAAGSVNLDYHPGDFMLIRDHISSFAPSPLIGPNREEMGPRFPDMSAVYDEELGARIRAAAGESGISLREGVYIQFTGPQFESPAEIRMSRTLGADAVGMSTVCEAIAAHHMGLRVCGISCIANYGCGITDKKLSGADVDEMAAKAAPAFRELVTRAVAKMGELV